MKEKQHLVEFPIMVKQPDGSSRIITEDEAKEIRAILIKKEEESRHNQINMMIDQFDFESTRQEWECKGFIGLKNNKNGK